LISEFENDLVDLKQRDHFFDWNSKRHDQHILRKVFWWGLVKTRYEKHSKVESLLIQKYSPTVYNFVSEFLLMSWQNEDSFLVFALFYILLWGPHE
jgi:hypothetical protein